MRNSIGDRNSDAALRFAAKKKEQLQRANALRLEREQASIGVSSQERMRDFTPTNAIVGSHQSSRFSTGGFDVEARSYGPSTERIVIRPSKMLCDDRDKFETDYSDPPASMKPNIKFDVKGSNTVVTAASYRRPSAEGVSVDDSSTDVSGDGIHCSAQRTNHVHRANSDTFFAPPSDPSGIQVDLSDRPLLCMSTDGRDEVVVGGADHALYAIQVSSLYDNRGRPTRPKKMYGPRHGHSDWITSVAHLADGRVLSAAMDAKLCLWSVDRSRCTDLLGGHSKSIAKVITDERYNIAMSCGYDGLVALWSFGQSGPQSSTGAAGGVGGRKQAAGSSSSSSGGSAYLASQRRANSSASSSSSSASTSTSPATPAGILSGHSDPVVECTYNSSSVCASGSRSGELFLWDLNTCSVMNRYQAHKGSVTVMESLHESDLFLTAGVDGMVKLWDPRERSCLTAVPAHVGTVSRQPGRGADQDSSSSSSTSSSRGGGSSRGRGSGGGSGSRSGEEARGGRGGGEGGVLAAAVSCMSSLREERGGGVSLVITGGTDSTICVLDARMSFAVIERWQHHKIGIYSMCVLGSRCVMTGDGAGMMLCYDCIGGDGGPGASFSASVAGSGSSGSSSGVRYGLGASEQGAVRGITAVGNCILTAGEDGNVLSYIYS